MMRERTSRFAIFSQLRCAKLGKFSITASGDFVIAEEKVNAPSPRETSDV
jgi:hypothetical protein